MRMWSVFLGVVVAVVCIAIASTGFADEEAYIERRGFFKEITDAESKGLTIQTFRASGDGSRVAYFGWNAALSQHELWVVDADGQNDTLVERSYEWESLYFGRYDISHDGSTIAYLRKEPPGGTPQLVVHDVGTATTTPILDALPVSNYGTPETWNLDPRLGLNQFRISGDGSRVCVLNYYGPVYGPTDWSGATYYRVESDGAGASVAIETLDIQSIPGINADANSLGQISVNSDGSKVAFAAYNAGSARPLNLVVMDGDGSNPTVLLDTNWDGNFYGPSMSDNGTRIAYARGGTTLPDDTGTFVTNAGLPQNPVQVDAGSGYWGVDPHLASDGSAVTYNFDLGGGSSPSIRWARGDGTQRLPLTVGLFHTIGATSMVAAGGQRVFMIGTTQGAVPGVSEILRFDFGSTPFPGIPTVTSVSGSPDMTVNLNDGYYTFSMTTTGGNPREMFTIPFTDDPAVLVFNGFGGFYYGFHGLLDNGTSGGDPVAGDGVFTNDGVWLVAEPPAGVDPFVLRAAVSTDEGVASFADAVVSFTDPYPGGIIFADDFEEGHHDNWSASR